MKPTAKERFEAKVRVTPSCWLWTASLGSTGYGQFSLNRRPQKAHRVSHELYIGPIPAGLCVLHKCDNPRCVNPDHFFLGTPADNAADKVQKLRQARGPAHGMKGELHPMARLTAQQAANIRADQRSTTALAAEYGVSKSLVSQIRAGKVWRTA